MRATLSQLYSGRAEPAPQKARPTERPQPLRSNVTAAMFVSQAVDVGVQALAAYLCAVIFQQYAIHLTVFAVAQQHYPSWTARGGMDGRTIARRRNAITGEAHEFVVPAIGLAGITSARYCSPFFFVRGACSATQCARLGWSEKKAVALPCATAPLEVGQHHTTTTLLPGERLKGASPVGPSPPHDGILIDRANLRS